ncbi:hypothetical protein ACFLVZ_02840 [Chloroflexota bacterium]
MSIDGHYMVEMDTTIGPQSIELALNSDDDSLSGSMDGHFGAQTFSDGTINGNEFSWTVKLQSPMGEMQLEVTGTAEGDEISGQVQLGSFRPSTFKGVRS